MHMFKLLLLCQFSLILSLPHTILVPSNNSNNKKKILFQPKQRNITISYHHDNNKDNNGKKRVYLPKRMIENLPKERRQEQELQQNNEDTHIANSTTPRQPQIIHIPNMQETISNNNMQVLFYDPSRLYNNIPEKIFDEDGNEVDLSGQQVLLLPPESSNNVDNTTTFSPDDNDINNITQALPNLKMVHNNDRINGNPKQSIRSSLSTIQKNHPKDNMILFGTILTMSLFVGALTGKRIRKSCNFLAYFIESEDMGYEEEEEGSQVGSLNMLGSNYDTFGKYGGEMRWRGDLEKFDV